MQIELQRRATQQSERLCGKFQGHQCGRHNIRAKGQRTVAENTLIYFIHNTEPVSLDATWGLKSIPGLK